MNNLDEKSRWYIILLIGAEGLEIQTKRDTTRLILI